MFFRFAAGLFLVVLVSMAGVRLEKQTLEMRREVSVQYYQTDLLLELLVRLRLDTQKLTAPAQLAATIEDATHSRTAKSQGVNSLQSQSRTAFRSSDDASTRDSSNSDSATDTSDEARLPLLRFQQPFNPEGID